jgi:hypothetical protein
VQAHINEPEVWVFLRSQTRWIPKARLISVTETEVVFRYETNDEFGNRLWEITCELSDLMAIEKKIEQTPDQLLTLREILPS